MIPAARSRRSPLPVPSSALAAALALALTLGAAAPPAGAAPATASPEATAASALAPALAAPRVDIGGEVDDVPAIEVILTLDVGEVDLRDARYEYRLDGSTTWLTAYTGDLDGAVVRIPAPAGPHTAVFRAAGTVDGAPVLGAVTAPVAVRSLGYPTAYSPVITVDGPRFTLSWDVRAALAGWPEEGSVHWSVDGGVETVASAVGSVVIEPGYDRTVQVGFWYGGNVDIARYLYVGVTTASAPGSTPFTSTPSPTILGHAAIGRTLSVRTGVWRPGEVALTYRWLRDGRPIPAETQATYVVGPDDAGTRITVAVRGTAPGRTSVERVSAATPRVGAWAITPGTPVVTGIAAVGRELIARPGSWRPAPVSFTYRWLRDGVEVRGATKERYALTAADRGHVVSVRVTGSKQLYPDAARESAGRRIG